MNRLLLIIFLLMAFAGSFAQNSSKDILVINLKDKGSDSEKSVLAPSDYLSEKAVARRLKHDISFNDSDLPVCDRYVNSILETGVTLLSRSRWLNCIVVEGNIEQMGAINKLPCVKNVSVVGTSGIPNAGNFNRKSLVKLSEMPEKQPPKNTISGNTFNYGAAANQISQINGTYLHNLNYCGQGMTIAVLDNGFNRVDMLNAFDSLWTNNQILGTKDFVTPGSNVFDPDGGIHGTWVLSTMASNLPGTIVGTAPRANYWLIHTEDNAGEAVIEEYYWVSGAEFADSVGADVINSSLGYTTFLNSPDYNHTYADMDGNTCISSIGADMAAKKGILVVNSAGNSGESWDPWQYIGAPADGDSVFSIGAVDAAGNRSSFSSKGPTSDGQLKPDIVAQGSGTAIYTWNTSTQTESVAYGSGTSFSSPIIAGMSACLWQAAPDKSNMDIIECLRTTASKSQSPDTLMGWGIPDYEQAHLALTAGVNELTGKPALKVFPNPFGMSFTLVLPFAVSGNVRIEILTVDGKTVLGRETETNHKVKELYINGLGQINPGFYILRLFSGSEIFTTTCVRL